MLPNDYVQAVTTVLLYDWRWQGGEDICGNSLWHDGDVTVSSSVKFKPDYRDKKWTGHGSARYVAVCVLTWWKLHIKENNCGDN